MSMESNKATESIKFLCSYGGKILPRRTDGQLRYVGGHTRVLAVDRSISFAELMVKLLEFCGHSVILRCQLPNGDLETLISITSDEDLKNLIEEYDRASRPQKIRAVLSPPPSLKKISPPLSTTTSANSSPSGSPLASRNSCYRFMPRTFTPVVRYPATARNCSGKAYRYGHQVQANPGVAYPCCVPHSNYWH